MLLEHLSVSLAAPRAQPGSDDHCQLKATNDPLVVLAAVAAAAAKVAAGRRVIFTVSPSSSDGVVVYGSCRVNLQVCAGTTSGLR